MAAAAATAARMAAGRAHDWSARDLPASEHVVASGTGGDATPMSSARKRTAVRAASAFAAPPPDGQAKRANTATSVPAPAAEPEAAIAPKEGSPTVAEHRRIIDLLQTRHAASFWSGIDEAAMGMPFSFVSGNGMTVAKLHVRSLYAPMPSACGIMVPPPWPMQTYPGRLRVEAPAVRHSKSRSAV